MDQVEGWVFPSGSKPGHLTTVATAFETARSKVKLSSDIKLYSGRPRSPQRSGPQPGNLSLVMRPLGHSNAQTAMIYQHPSMEDVCEVVNARPLAASPKLGSVLVRHNPRHSTGNGAK